MFTQCCLFWLVFIKRRTYQLKISIVFFISASRRRFNETSSQELCIIKLKPTPVVAFSCCSANASAFFWKLLRESLEYFLLVFLDNCFWQLRLWRLYPADIWIYENSVGTSFVRFRRCFDRFTKNMLSLYFCNCKECFFWSKWWPTWEIQSLISWF